MENRKINQHVFQLSRSSDNRLTTYHIAKLTRVLDEIETPKMVQIVLEWLSGYARP
jgi:hypothetical protein